MTSTPCSCRLCSRVGGTLNIQQKSELSAPTMKQTKPLRCCTEQVRLLCLSRTSIVSINHKGTLHPSHLTEVSKQIIFTYVDVAGCYLWCQRVVAAQLLWKEWTFFLYRHWKVLKAWLAWLHTRCLGFIQRGFNDVKMCYDPLFRGDADGWEPTADGVYEEPYAQRPKAHINARRQQLIKEECKNEGQNMEILFHNIKGVEGNKQTSLKRMSHPGGRKQILTENTIKSLQVLQFTVCVMNANMQKAKEDKES